MNEPSVFNQEEVTFPRDNIHFNGKEFVYHKDIHNLYGLLYHKTTYNALNNRYNCSKRVFVLSRSFFLGTQKLGFVWTGDNRSNYDFLKYSIPVLNTISSCGISACGADIGGFFGTVTEDLLKTWYSVGVFYPFFRGHCHYDSPNREPYLHSYETYEKIKDSIILRYNLLLYFYTKYFENGIIGCPLIKPIYLLVEYLERFSEDREEILSRIVESNFVFGDEFVIAPYIEKAESIIKEPNQENEPNEIFIDLKKIEENISANDNNHKLIEYR